MEEPRPEDIEKLVRELEQEYGTDESLPPEAGMKARVCPKCSKHNLENAWHCIDCGTTLSMKTLMDMEDGQSSGLSSISPYFEQDVAEILDTVVQNGESVILGCNISFGYLLVTSQRLIRVQFQPEVTKGATRVDWLDVLVNLLSFLLGFLSGEHFGHTQAERPAAPTVDCPSRPLSPDELASKGGHLRPGEVGFSRSRTEVAGRSSPHPPGREIRRGQEDDLFHFLHSA